MLTGLYFTDTHDQGRNPGARIDNYHQAIMNKFKEVAEVAIANDVDFIVHGGDWFDTPRVAYSLYNQHQRILRRIRSKGIKVYLVPGNHDLYGYSMDTLDQTAIGALAQSGLVTLLTRRKHYILDDVDFKLAIHGREYDKDIDHKPLTDYYIDKVADYDILFSHGMLLEKPFHPDVRYTLTKNVVTNADVVLNGHYHPGYDLHEENGTLFGNPGSTGRDEGSVDNEKRIPQYAMMYIDKDGIDVEYVEFKVAQKGKDIFDRTQIVQKKQHVRYLEAFEQTIEDALAFEEFDPKDILSKTTGLDPKLINTAIDAIVDMEKLVQDGKLDGYVEKQKALGISSIELTNFQSHKKTKVELNEKGLNALTGSSDSGKSAIIRALRWVFYNEPKGTDFIRYGESRATVTVTFTDGSSITRSRTNSSAGEYIVRDSNGKETEFKGFGNNLPIDIANTHQMPKVELSTGVERPLNFSYQLDGHFLLSESPAVRANTIGRLTGVHVVDAAIKEKAKEIRQVTVATNATEKQIEQLDEDLKAFSDLDDVQKSINILNGLVTTAQNLQDDIGELEVLEEHYFNYTDEMKDLKVELKQYDKVDRGLLIINQAETLQSEIVELSQLNKVYRSEKQLVSEIKLDLADYEDLDEGLKLLDSCSKVLSEKVELESLAVAYNSADKGVKELEEGVKLYSNLDNIDIDAMQDTLNEVEELKTLMYTLANEDKAVTDLQEELDLQEHKIDKIQAKISDVFKKMGNKCPTCLQEVSEHALDEMLQHV